MFLKRNCRVKDGKDHYYWNIVGEVTSRGSGRCLLIFDCLAESRRAGILSLTEEVDGVRLQIY